MPVPPCLRLVDEVLPRVRIAATQRLLRDGWSQTRIAAALGVSQAMVSKYVRMDGPTDALALRLAEELAGDLADRRPAGGASPWCTTLSLGGDRPGARAALDDLLAAERRLLAAQPVHVVPQVGLNLARALPEPAGPEDVLAYPARFVAAGDHIVRPLPPAFGASNHLSRCLLALRARDPDLHAIANIRGDATIAKVVKADVTVSGPGEREDLIAAAVDRMRGSCRIVHDAGAVGIEPCLYVAAPTASEVVTHILDLAERLRG